MNVVRCTFSRFRSANPPRPPPRTLRIYDFHSSIFLPRPREEVFAFFADAANLQALTPPWLHFSVLTQAPIRMHPGAIIDYRLRIRAVPVRWRTRIVEWDPPRGFIDEQVRGPYRLWVHRHTFAEAEGGTIARDHVRYAIPGGPLAPLLHAVMVGPDVRRIFEYRRRALERLFPPATPRA